MSQSSRTRSPDLTDPPEPASSRLHTPSLSDTVGLLSITPTGAISRATAESHQGAVAPPRRERVIGRPSSPNPISSLCAPQAGPSSRTAWKADLGVALAPQLYHDPSIPTSRFASRQPDAQIPDTWETKRIDSFDLALEIARLQAIRSAPPTEETLRRQEMDQTRRDKQRERTRRHRERKRLKQSGMKTPQGATLGGLGGSEPAMTVPAAASERASSTVGPQRSDASWLHTAMAQSPGTISLGVHGISPELNLEEANDCPTWHFAGQSSDPPPSAHTIPAAGIADFRPPENLHWSSLNQSFDVGVSFDLHAPLQASVPQAAASVAQFAFDNAATNTALEQPWSQHPWAIEPGAPSLPSWTGGLSTSWNHGHVPVPVNADPPLPAKDTSDISGPRVSDITGEAQATFMPTFGATVEANERAQYLALTPRERANVRNRQYRARRRADKLAQQREQYKDKDQFDFKTADVKRELEFRRLESERHADRARWKPRRANGQSEPQPSTVPPLAALEVDDEGES